MAFKITAKEKKFILKKRVEAGSRERYLKRKEEKGIKRYGKEKWEKIKEKREKNKKALREALRSGKRFLGPAQKFSKDINLGEATKRVQMQIGGQSGMPRYPRFAGEVYLIKKHWYSIPDLFLKNFQRSGFKKSSNWNKKGAFTISNGIWNLTLQLRPKKDEHKILISKN